MTSFNSPDRKQFTIACQRATKLKKEKLKDKLEGKKLENKQSEEVKDK